MRALGCLGSRPLQEPRGFPGLGSLRFAFLCFSRVGPAGGFGFREMYEWAGDGRCWDVAREPGSTVLITRETRRYFSYPAVLGFDGKIYFFLKFRIRAAFFGSLAWRVADWI